MKASCDRQQARPGFGLGFASFLSALNRVLLCMFLAGVGISAAIADSKVVEGTRYADQIDESASGVPVEVFAKGGADDIHGSQFSDLIEPGTGNDVVFAGGGDDVLVFSGASLGVDVVAGGEGYDRIIGGAGDDTIGFNKVYGGNKAVEEIDGGAGHNVIEGGRYSDNLDFSQTLLINIAVISGLRGADTVAGTQTADVIEGGAGNDTLYGRAGDDTFLTFGAGNDFDLVRGDEGIDRILGSPGDDVIGLRGYSGSNSVEIIDGGAGNNTIQGTAFADFLDFQNTTLLSIAMIDGGDGSDSIVGSQGDDVIAGGKGNDTVDGGYGFDTAVFPGPQSDYEIFFGNTSTTVIKVSSNGANESDVLIAVEQMRFSDGIVPISGDNRPPIVVDDVLDAIEDTAAVYLPTDLTGNDADPDGDPIEIVSVNAVFGGDVRLQSNGNVRFQPDANFSGDARFSYVVEDEMQARSSGSVTVRVAPVNDPPVASDDAFLTGVDTELVMQSGVLLANDSDVDADDRLAIVRVDNAVNGTARLLADGAIAFMPDAGFIGQGRMRYFVEDEDGESDDALIFVDVGAENGAPLARNDNVEVNEDTVLVLAAKDLLANDDDPDGDPIEIIEVKDGVNGQVSWSANGSVSFVPEANFSGSAQFTYVISDGQERAEGFVIVEVLPTNDLPVAETDTFSANVDQIITFDPGQFLANDTDVDGDPLGISSVFDPVNCSVKLNRFGRVVFTPDSGFRGRSFFSYEVNDGFGGTAIALVTINVGSSFRILANNKTSSILQWDGATWEFLGELVTKPSDTQLPHSITLGPDGNLYVGWTGKGTSKPASVRKHDPITGEQLGVFSTFEMESDDTADKLEALAFAPNGQLLVADNTGWGGARKIFRFQGLGESNPGAFIDEFIGYDEYQQTRSFETWDLEFDKQGNLLVPSAARHEIIIFQAPEIGGGKSRILDMFASGFVYEDRDDGVFKRIPGRFSDPAESGFNAQTMTSPYGLAWGPDGNLYVSVRDAPDDYGRIMYFSDDGEYLGDYVSTQDYSAITASKPKDIDFGPDGNLYVTNQKDSVILIFGGPDGPQRARHIGTLTAPDWVTFNGSNAIEFVVDD